MLVKRKGKIIETERQKKIFEKDIIFYKELDKIFNEYDDVIHSVHLGADKVEGYYELCRILYKIKSLYDI